MKIAVSAQALLVLWKKISSLVWWHETALQAVQSASWLICLKMKKNNGFMASQWESREIFSFFWCYQDRWCLCSVKIMPGKRYSWDKSGSLCDNHIVWVLIPCYHQSYENTGEVAAAKQKERLTTGKHQVIPTGKMWDKSVPGEATVIWVSWISWIPQRLILPSQLTSLV